MKIHTRTEAALALAVLLTASSAVANSSTHDNLAAYNSATGNPDVVIDTFDGSSKNAVSLTTDIGIVSTLTNGSPSNPPDNYYNDAANFDASEFGFALHRSGSVATRNVVWEFPETVTGFYGEFESVTGIDVGIGATQGEVSTWYDISDVADPNPGPNPASGFFGLVDTDGFDSVIFRVDPSFGSSFDSYWLTSMGFTPESRAMAVGSLAEYDAKVGQFTKVIDTFDGSSENAVSLTTDIGIVSTLTNGSPSNPPDNYYNDAANFDASEFGFALDRSGSVATRNVVWEFPETITGFYGEFESVTGIDVGIGANEGEVEKWFDISDFADPNPGPNPASGFFGLTDPDGFDTVIFRVDPTFGSSFDSYWLTSMGYSTTTSIPEPMSLALVGLGVLVMPHRRRD